MRVPSKLIEKTLSALQIAKVTGTIKTGLFENMRSLEANKVKYLILSADLKPRDDKIRKRLMVLRMLLKDKKIPCFELSTKEELGKIVGIDMGTSSIAIIDSGRASSMFKDLAADMERDTN